MSNDNDIFTSLEKWLDMGGGVEDRVGLFRYEVVTILTEIHRLRLELAKRRCDNVNSK